MDNADRDDHGRFRTGNRVSVLGGSPPKKYSITRALAAAADVLHTIRDGGTPLTKAEAAAEWLWNAVLDDQLSFNDRLEALTTILKATETEPKIQSLNDSDAPPQMPYDLRQLSSQELLVLKQTLAKAKVPVAN